MCGADRNEHAGFTNLEAAEAMGNRDAMNREICVELGGDFANFGDGHGFVGLVLEIESGTIVGMVADATVESDDGPSFGCADVADDSVNVDWLATQKKKLGIGRCRHRSAPADRGQERHFVAGVEWGGPRGEFAIARGDQGGAKICQLRVGGDKAGKHDVDRRAIRKVHRNLGEANDFAQTSEEEDFDCDGRLWFGRGHPRIVPRGSGEDH
jgi:hypothetical protein